MHFLIFIVALLASAILSRLVRDYSVAHGWVSSPALDRHVHTRPIPRLGGVAIFLTLCCTALLAHWSPAYFGTREFSFSQLALKILGPATIIFLIGLIDDFYGISAYVKFAAEAGAAVLLFSNGLGISRLSILAGHPHLGWLVGLPLTILWVLWITNAFNLIDGLDGLAAGSALFSSLVTCVVAMLDHNEVVLVLTLALAGAITGFLRYNFNPASIFLGDCGSLLIGFLLGAIALASSQKSPTMVAVAIPIVSLGLPILDAIIAVIRRFLSRCHLFRADSEHIHHRLISRGMPHRQAVLLLYGVSGAFGLLSLFLLNPGSRTIGMVLVVLGIGVLVGVQQLRYHEFFALRTEASRTLNLRHVIANNANIRRAGDRVPSCETLADFCATLQKCLQPIGSDGFGIRVFSNLPDDLDYSPLQREGGNELYQMWDASLGLDDANWNLTFSLATRDNRRLGSFTLYRKSTVSPLWLDLSVFTTTGFSEAVADKVDHLQNGWPVPERAENAGVLKRSAASAAGD